MKVAKIAVLSAVTTAVLATAALAQFPVIAAEDVVNWTQGTKKAVLIDARMRDEYAEAHIPGAVNIPAERMKAEKARLPKDRSAPIIFYCRGAG